MTWTFQSASSVIANNDAGNSTTITTGTLTAAPNNSLIVLGAVCNGVASSITFSDSTGSNTYLPIGGLSPTFTSKNAQLAYLYNVTNGPTTYTVTFNLSVVHTRMFVAVFTNSAGAWSSAPLDQGPGWNVQATPASGANTLTSTTVTTTSNGELAVGVCYDSNENLVTIGTTLAWSLAKDQSTFDGMIEEYFTQTSSGGIAATFGTTHTTDTFITGIATFAVPPPPPSVDMSSRGLMVLP